MMHNLSSSPSSFLRLRHRVPCGALIVLAVILVSTKHAADTIDVAPGPNAIAGAIAQAKDGDIIALAPGRYEESIRLPSHMTLKGSGVDNTIIVGQDYATIQVTGTEVIIRDLEVRGSADTRRGVTGEGSIRVERCRFVELPEAVAIMSAPLTDIVHCEFLRCDIGVRAIGEASPTVWGCRFDGGRIGVFALDGAPHVRNSVFTGLKTGMLLISKTPHIMTVRHNVLIDCAEQGIEMKGEWPLGIASVRNNVFVRCATVIKADEGRFRTVSHNVLQECGDAPFKNENSARIDPALEEITSVDLGLQVAEDGTIRVADEAVLEGKGRPLAADPEDYVVPIGLEENCERPGSRPLGNALVPQIRWLSEPIVVNSVGEEYQYMRLHGLRSVGQSLLFRDGVPMDEQRILRDGEETSLYFDISRFHGEM